MATGIPTFRVDLAEGMIDVDTSADRLFAYCIEADKGPINTPRFVSSNKEAMRIFGVDFAPHFYQNQSGIFLLPMPKPFDILLRHRYLDLYRQYAEDDEAESTAEAHPDTTSDTYTLYMKGELYARLRDAYDKLEYTERMMLAQRLGFCFECHSTFYMDFDDLDEYGEPKKKSIKPMMYTDIATDHEYSSANTAHKKCEKALAKLKEAIKDLI